MYIGLRRNFYELVYIIFDWNRNPCCTVAVKSFFQLPTPDTDSNRNFLRCLEHSTPYRFVDRNRSMMMFKYFLCLFRLAFDSNCNRYSIINIVAIVSFFFLLLFFLRTIGFWILLVWNVAKNLSNELIFQKEVKCIESKFDRTIIK